MSRPDTARVIWKCPECHRNFKVPKSKPRPSACAQCLKKLEASGLGAAESFTDDGEIHFREVEPATPGSLKFASKPIHSVSPNVPASPNRSVVREKPVTEIPESVSVEVLSDRLDEVLEHLNGISHTMKLVRRVVWGIGLATLLSMVVTGAGLLYSMSLIGSLSNLLGGSGELIPQEAGQEERHGQAVQGGDVRIPPQMQQNMKQIEEYSRTMNELLKEANQ